MSARVLQLVFMVTCVMFASSKSIAQSSSRRVSTDPIGQYQILKRVVRDTLIGDKEYPADTPGFGLFECPASLGYETGLRNRNGESQDDSLLYVARSFARWEWLFSASGYPRTLWASELAELENKTIAKYKRATAQTRKRARETDWFTGPELDGLETSLNLYRENHNKNLPSIHRGNTTECGDGEVFIKIDARPPGAKVWFLVEFYYMLCKAQGIDPLDMKVCDRWVEAATSVFAVAGDYRYLAVWPNGTKRTGLLQFNGKQFEGAVIRIRP